MSKFDPFKALAIQAKKRHMLMEANPDDVLRLYEQRDELLAALDELFEIGQVFASAIEAEDISTDFEVWAEKARAAISKARSNR